MKKTKVIGSLILSTCITACDGVKSAGTSISSSSDIGANIAGIVTESNSSLSVQSTGSGLFSKLFATSNENSTMSASGCSVQAYDISTGTAVGSPTTTDSAGGYTLTGVTSGETYKVVAECSGFTLASVSTADTKDPASKDKEVTNPLSSIIATMIVKEVVSQLESTFGALPAAFKQQAIKALAPTVMSLMKSLVTDSVNSGTMLPPSTSEANTVAANLKVPKTATELTTVINTYDTVKPIPPAVTQGSKAAGAQAAAMKDCDSAITDSTAVTCRKAMAKLMYNGLGFGVGLNLTAGGSPAGVFTGACDDTNLGSDFPNAEFIDHVAKAEIPAGYCFVKPKFKPMDRNNETEGGSDHGPVFIESGLMGTDPIIQMTGFITELGSAMFAKNKYLLSDLDKIVFAYNSDKAGMNLRLFQQRKSYGENGETTSFYYLNSSGVWTSMGSANPKNLSTFDTSSGGWPWTASGGSNADLISAIDAGGTALLNKGVFMKKFGGAVPTLAQLEGMMNNSKAHTDHNPSGGKEFHVLFSVQPKFEVAVENSSTHEKTRPCEDNDPSTACIGVDNTGADVLHPEVMVKVTYASLLEDGAFKNVKPISSVAIASPSACATSITQIAAGTKEACYYLQPLYSQNKFSGAFNFIRTFDGQFLRDQNNNTRVMKIVTAGDCTNFGSTVTNCAANDAFNVVSKWSEGAISFTVLSGTEISKSDGVGNKLDGIGIFTEQWQPSTNGSWKPGVIAKRSMSGAVALELVGTPASLTTTTPELTNMTARYFSSSSNSGSGVYNAVVYKECNSLGCNNPTVADAKVYLIDAASGAPFVDSNASAWDASNKTTVWRCTTPGVACEQAVTPLFSATGLVALIGDTMAQEVSTFFIPSGPVANPNWRCDQEPFFKDGNGDGKLNCDSANIHTAASGGDVSYSSFDDVRRAQEKFQQQGSPGVFMYMANDNAYQYANPAGPKKLLTTAFNGWFDGAHKITATTELDALQAFSLIFMFFEDANKELHLEGMDTSNEHGYSQSSPMFGSGGGDDPTKINTALGKGIGTYKQ